MQQPERLYYPLVKASQILNCEPDYLIHLAATGFSEVCIKYAKNESKNIFTWSASLNHDELKCAADKYQSGGDSRGNIKTHFTNKLLSVVLYIKSEVAEDGEIESYPSEFDFLSGVLKIPTSAVYDNEIDLVHGNKCDIYNLCIPDSQLPYQGELLDFEDTLLAENGLSFSWFEPFSVSIDDLLVTHEEICRLRVKGFPSFSDMTGQASNSQERRDPFDNPKTLAGLPDLTKCLLALIPSLSDVDVDAISDAKLKDLIEAEATSKKIPFPSNMHRQTVGKYFGKTPSRKQPGGK